MSGEAGSVEALLKLDTSGFDTGMTNSMDKVTKFVESLEKLGANSKTTTEGFQRLQSEIRNLNTAINSITSSSEKFSNFDKGARDMNNLVNAAIKFNKEGSGTTASFEAMASAVKAFNDIIGGAEIKLKGFVQVEQQIVSQNESLKKSTYNVDSEYNRLRQNLLQTANALTTARRNIQTTSEALVSAKTNLSTFNTTLNRTSSEIIQSSTNYSEFTNTVNRGSASFTRAYEELMLLTRGVEKFNAVSAVSNKIDTLNFSNSLSNMREVEAAMGKVSTSTDKAAKSASSAQGSFRGLGNVLSSLKGIGMMVASMFAYNFLHSLGQAVSETITARSEMYSLFDTMGMTTSQINTFNGALDETVTKFQRVNKYSLGETVAGIGVEFDLTTEEMTKAMDVTSMITSEYLRAGRSASEASLAVKDIMQGQFQRLSRETGVKQKDLEAAGWDGDTSNVLGLMEALDKVAHSRNWDIFAEKANSLSDIVLITQNRFGEWAADTSQYIVPVITTAFNVLVTAVSSVTGVLGGISSALKLPDWAGTAILVGGLTTAVLSLIPALITHRTGLGLVDIATRGWKDSILGAVFGLKAEKEANLSSTKALAAKLLGLKAEEVAEMGVKRALIDKLEIEHLQQALDRRTSTLIIGKVLALDMEAVAQHGLMGAIGVKTASQLVEIGVINEATAAELSHRAAMLLGIATIGVYAAALAALAAAFVALVVPIMESASSMEKFNSLIKEGDNLMKDAYKTRAKFEKQYDDVSDKLNTLTVGTREYNLALAEQEQAYNNMDYMETTYIPNLQKAINLAKDSQDFYDSEKIKSAANAERELNDAFLDLGINAEIAGEMASTALADARIGAQTLYHALQVYNKDLEQHNQGTISLVAHLKKSGMEDEEIEEIADAYQAAWEKYEQNKQTWMTSEDFGERINAGLGMALNSVEIWWAEFNGYLEGGDNAMAFEKFWKGIAHGLHDLPFIGDIWDSIFGAAGFEKYAHKGWDGLGQLVTDWIGNIPILSNIWDIIFGGDNETNLTDVFKKLLVDGINAGLNGVEFLDSISNFGDSLMTGLSELPSNISSFFSGIYENVSSFASDLLNQGITAGSNFVNGVTSFISQLPGKVYSFILSTGTYILNGAAVWASYGMEKARLLVNAVKNVVSELPGKVYNEFAKIPGRIRDAITDAVNAAKDFGKQIIDAVLNAMGIHSPGIVQNKVTAEFVDTVSNIQSTISSAQSVGDEFGSAIVDGVNGNLVGGFITDYSADANQINTVNQAISSDTASTFNSLSSTVDSTVSSMGNDIVTAYSNMNTTQNTMLTTMSSQNKSSFNNLQTQTNDSLNNMRDSTSRVTTQMIGAWDYMKDNIIASANQLKTQSNAHFNNLSQNIGSFYRKLQNPSLWGSAGSPDIKSNTPNTRGGAKKGIRAVNRVFNTTGYAGSPQSSYNKISSLGQYATARKLKEALCVDGDCGLFDGMDLDSIINIPLFLSTLDGGFGWNNWHTTHFSKIKSTTGEYDMKSPMLMNRIDSQAKFKPKEFYNGKPNVSFSQFQTMAEALFSNVGYDFYYNSDKYGNWVNAIQSGGCNCYDGANALIALANTCGFSGTIAHGTWNGIPHVYAVIEGKKMDTTGWQQRRNWNGVAAGSPPNYKSTTEDKHYYFNIDMSNSVFYGDDDFEDRMRGIAQRVLREEVNTSITVGI